MKRTFKKRYLDWVMLLVATLSLLDNALLLFQEFEFLASAILRWLFFLSALTAVLSLFLRNVDTEKWVRIFIVSNLVFPPLFVINQIISDYAFYLTLRTDLIENYLSYLNLIIGIILLVLSIKLSLKSEQERRKEYSFILICIGGILLVWPFIKMWDYQSLVIATIIFKFIIAISLIYLGYRFGKKPTRKVRIGIITAVLLFINNSF